MHKAYHFRLYPTKEQQEHITKIIGSCRYIYNYYLNKRIEIYQATKETFNYGNCSADLKALNFFQKQAGFPRFKSKRNSKQTYRTQMVNNNIKIIGDKIVLPKIGAVSFVKSREIEGSITSVTVKKTASSKYFASVLAEAPEPKPLPETSQMVGVDLGIKDLVVFSTGEVVANPKTLAKAEKKLIWLQKSLSKKQKGSKNREKARIKLAVQHEKVANIRKDHLHKLSTRLIHENQVICMETLKPKNMMKNKRLAKSISDAGWGMFRQMLLYKAQWYGRTVHCIDPYFPSSQLCSACGCQSNKAKDLAVRTWQCPQCKASLQRDVNAGINILKQGLTELAIAV